MTFEQALKQYRERFDDAYPLMCRQGVDKSDMVAEILECLSRGEKVSIDRRLDY